MGEPTLENTTVPLSGSVATAALWKGAGQLRVTVVTKASFGFVENGTMARTTPQPTFAVDVHHGKNPGRSLRFTSDVAPYLPQADVLLTGFAEAPSGTKPPSVVVRLSVTDGARKVLEKTAVARDPAGVDRIPLVYENALGALDHAENPFGSASPKLVDPRDVKRPVGFGPIGRAWPLRRRFLGQISRKVADAAVPDLPDGFDWRYYQAAPLDQRVPFLRGDERIQLEGVDRVAASIEMQLPRATPIARIQGLSAFGIEDGRLVPMVIDTLRIDAEDRVCTLVARGSFVVPNDAALRALTVAAGFTIAGEAPAWPSEKGTRAPAAALPAVDAGATRMMLDDGAAQPSMPFRSASERPLPRTASSPPARDPSGTIALLEDDLEVVARAPGTTLNIDESAHASSPPLPFPSSSAPNTAQPASAIPGAPWSQESAAKSLNASPGQAHTFYEPELEAAPEAKRAPVIAPPPPAPPPAPAPPKDVVWRAPDPEPPLPPPPAPKKLAAAQRKDVNALLYGSKTPKRRP